MAIGLLAGLTAPVSAAATSSEQTARAEITVTAGDRRFVYVDALLAAPDHTVYEQIEHRGINAPLGEKMKTVDRCLAAGAKWREAMRYAFPRLPAFVDEIRSAVDREPKDSEIAFRPDEKPMFSITRARDGAELDEKRLWQEIYLGLKKGNKVRITVIPKRIPAAVTEAENSKLTKCISSFATSFATSAEGRKKNIRLALGKINGTVLLPGAEFSFNAAVGPRTEQNGFSVAKIIVAGEYTDGVGGGVCQASTTVYNAALVAGMRVTAVRNHTILPSYVAPSLDAMVNSSSADLRFVNPYDTPVFIRAVAVGDTARVAFYGAPTPYRIVASSRVLGRTPVPADREIVDTEHKYIAADLPKGERVRVSYGHAGVKSEAYLRYFSPTGTLVREERIRSDAYAEVQGIVAVAPGA